MYNKYIVTLQSLAVWCVVLEHSVILTGRTCIIAFLNTAKEALHSSLVLIGKFL